MNDNGETIWSQVVDAVGGLFHRSTQDLITFLRVPTPVKTTFNLTADANGVIGGGFTTPNPVLVYSCPMSHEGWIHRIAITSPSGQPKAPLTVGQLILVGGSGEPIMFYPVGGAIAPTIITEGRASGFHLNAGSGVRAYGDSFTAGTSLRIDMQIVLVQGISEYTPRNQPLRKELVLE